jgi:hypothetical protein
MKNGNDDRKNDFGLAGSSGVSACWGSVFSAIFSIVTINSFLRACSVGLVLRHKFPQTHFRELSQCPAAGASAEPRQVTSYQSFMCPGNSGAPEKHKNIFHLIYAVVLPTVVLNKKHGCIYDIPVCGRINCPAWNGLKRRSAVSAPVFDAEGHVIATLSVVGPAFRMTKEKMKRFGEKCASAAARLSPSMQ